MFNPKRLFNCILDYTLSELDISIKFQEILAHKGFVFQMLFSQQVLVLTRVFEWRSFSPMAGFMVDQWSYNACFHETQMVSETSLSIIHGIVANREGTFDQ